MLQGMKNNSLKFQIISFKIVGDMGTKELKESLKVVRSRKLNLRQE